MKTKIIIIIAIACLVYYIGSYFSLSFFRNAVTGYAEPAEPAAQAPRIGGKNKKRAIKKRKR